eukprot:jgi/Tetstr1/453123/TSEL_040146.t1
MWHMLQGAVIHYPRDCEECDPLADGEECKRVNEYIKKQREEGFTCLLTYAQMCSMYLPNKMMKLNLHNRMRDVKCVARGSGTTDTERAYTRKFLLEARIKFMRSWLDPDFPSLPMWLGFVGQWEAAGVDHAVDMFEGTGPG